MLTTISFSLIPKIHRLIKENELSYERACVLILDSICQNIDEKDRMHIFNTVIDRIIKNV